MNNIPTMKAIPKTAIAKLLNDQTALCSSDPGRFTKAIGYVIRVYYGLKIENVEEETILLFQNTLFAKYPNMTFEQWNLIHVESVIEKKQGVSITVDELMQPVSSYYAKIQFVLSKKESILREQKEQAEIEERKQAHKEESIRLYIECVNGDGVWKGTPFHANVFAKESFAHRFTQPEKDSLYAEAKQQVKELEAKRKLSFADGMSFNEPIPDPVQMFSHLIVTEACKRGFEIIVG